jgi:hypothetical protein
MSVLVTVVVTRMSDPPVVSLKQRQKIKYWGFVTELPHVTV